MYKQISEKLPGYMRSVKRTVLFCDICGRRLSWCTPHPKGHFCERCLKTLKENKDIYTHQGEVNIKMSTAGSGLEGR